jgi:hypothetical protein
MSQFKPSTVMQVFTGFSTALTFVDPASAVQYYADHKPKGLALVSQSDRGYFVRSTNVQGVRFFNSFAEVSQYLTQIFNHD